MTSLPPVPEVTVMVPLPLVVDEGMEYVALKATLGFGPLGAPMSSVALILPVEVPPSAENSPENGATPNDAGAVVEPAYVPISAAFVNDALACGSPNPNKTLASETNRKT